MCLTVLIFWFIKRREAPVSYFINSFIAFLPAIVSIRLRKIVKDESFFRKNRTGILILPDRTYKLEVISCMLVKASDTYVFEPDSTRDDITGLLDYLKSNSMYLHEDVLQRARETDNLKILTLSTCSSEFTDARTVVITVMTPAAVG